MNQPTAATTKIEGEQLNWVGALILTRPRWRYLHNYPFFRSGNNILWNNYSMVKII